MVVVGVFLFAGFVFALYDITVEVRQRKVMRNALKTNAIVTSLFPGNVAARMIDDAGAEYDRKQKELQEEKENAKQLRRGTSMFMTNRQKLKRELHGGGSHQQLPAAPTEPTKNSAMAELFPSATVMVADICGFSSWSSARDPNQVFTMLETIFFGKFTPLHRFIVF